MKDCKFRAALGVSVWVYTHSPFDTIVDAVCAADINQYEEIPTGDKFDYKNLRFLAIRINAISIEDKYEAASSHKFRDKHRLPRYGR